jgi:hypothetical protein
MYAARCDPRTTTQARATEHVRKPGRSIVRCEAAAAACGSPLSVVRTLPRGMRTAARAPELVRGSALRFSKARAA